MSGRIISGVGLLGIAAMALSAVTSRDAIVRATPPVVPRPSHSPEPNPALKDNREMRRRRAHMAKVTRSQEKAAKRAAEWF